MSDTPKIPVEFEEDGSVKSVRISARISPFYKNGLDLIVRDRQTNLSEVLELAIVRLLNTYSIDGEKVMDFVGDSHLIFHGLFYDMRIKPATEESLKEIRKHLLAHLPRDVPLSLVSPKERYTASIINEVIASNSWISFFPKSIINAIDRGWAQALPATFIIEIIKAFNGYSQKTLIPQFSDKKLKANELTLECLIEKYPDIDWIPHYAAMREKYKELVELYNR